MGLWAPPLLLGGVGLAAGLTAPWLASPLIEPAIAAAYGERQAVNLTFWPGFGPILWLSLSAIAVGALCALALERVRAVARSLPLLTADRAYEGALTALNAIARWQTRTIQSGRLSRYVSVVVITTVALVAAPLIGGGAAGFPAGWADTRLIEAVLAAVVLAAAVAAAASSSRLAAVLALGVAGFGIALLFALLGAPDVAMTQVLVETLTVMLFVAVFRHLPVTAPRRPGWVRARDLVIAGAFGVMMTSLTWAVVAEPGQRHVSKFFLEASLPLAQGRNVVNTILVDFRALDTLGEIVVLGIAAMGVVALLRLRPHGEETGA